MPGRSWDRDCLLFGGSLVFLAVVGAAAILLVHPPRRSATISGSVMLDGQLVLIGAVTIVSADGKRQTGHIAIDGQYLIKDVPHGEIRASVLAPVRQEEYNARVETCKLIAARRGQPLPPIKPADVPLPPSYQDAAKSPLRMHVHLPHHRWNLSLMSGR